MNMKNWLEHSGSNGFQNDQKKVWSQCSFSFDGNLWALFVAKMRLLFKQNWWYSIDFFPIYAFSICKELSRLAVKSCVWSCFCRYPNALFCFNPPMPALKEWYRVSWQCWCCKKDVFLMPNIAGYLFVRLWEWRDLWCCTQENEMFTAYYSCDIYLMCWCVCPEKTVQFPKYVVCCPRVVNVLRKIYLSAPTCMDTGLWGSKKGAIINLDLSGGHWT